MNNMQVAHPSREQLAAFGLGRLGEIESLDIEGHLANCGACSAVVEGLPNDPFVSMLRGPTSGSETFSTASLGTRHAPEPDLLPADLPPGLADHPRYRVVELLGAGGMGAVYLAEHRVMERLVALKMINAKLIDDPAAVERFDREVKAAARLSHPNIVTAYDAEQAGDAHFLAMEFVEGENLAQVVADHGPLPVTLACGYVRQVALGLQHAFEYGLVHRDIKPQNLIVKRPHGGNSVAEHATGEVVKILDFGLARFVSEVASVEEGMKFGAVMGTPDYLAPEQARHPHKADIRADIYSLGCTLYFLLTGHAPFPGGTLAERVTAHLERMPVPLAELRSEVPAELSRIVLRMMAKDPVLRYQTPAEVADAVTPFAGQAPLKRRLPLIAGRC